MVFMCFFLCAPAWSQEEEIILEADRVIYEQGTQIGRAEGNARLNKGSLYLFAPLMEVNAETREVRAEGTPEKEVVIVEGDRRMSGRSLEYDLDTREGTLYNVNASLPVEKGQVYLKGENVSLAPQKVAREKEWFSIDETASEDEFAAKWENVSITTCREPEPHYRVVTKKLLIMPGPRVIARKPDIYLGKTKLFSSPSDYIFTDKKHSSFMPTLHYESDKGVGVGIRPAVALGSSATIDSRIVGWTEGGIEWRSGMEADFGQNWGIYASTAYEYDSQVEEKKYRPQWGVSWQRDGWSALAEWSEREVVEKELASGSTYKSTIWRDPEISVVSPWWDDPASVTTKWRMLSSWGRFEEGAVSSERSSWGIQLKGHSLIAHGNKALWALGYRYFDYDTGQSQEVTDATLGFEWELQDLSMITSYRRTWVSGTSPMTWDRYEDIEKIYQSLFFPLAGSLSLGLRGAYNLETSNLDESIYQVFLDRDCMQWVLTYRDDLVEEDDWASLKLVIKAFPETDLSVGSNTVSKWYEPGE